LVFIRMTGEVKVLDREAGYLKIEDKSGAGYMIKADADQLAGISPGDIVDVEIEWARGKASTIRCMGKA